ncbi:MAG: hypothetical protein K2P79_02905, partial [Sphingomonas sp.]|nr:hypothetical protein [Sphingomonas sp.]
MSSQVVETPLVSADMLTADRLTPDIAGLQPMESLKRRWPMWLGGLLTIAMIVGLARELLGAGLAGLTRSVPGDPWFYVAFALLYLSLPVGDFIIFRKLWGVPAGALAALIPEAVALRFDGSPGAVELSRRSAGFLAPWDGPAALVFT